MDVCDPKTRKDCATLKESLMDIDSNFDDDYNTVNDLNSKKKKKEPETKQKKKVTFDCNVKNGTDEETFDYEHEDVSDEEMSDEELEDESVSGGEDEDMSDEELVDNDHEETFDYEHEEEFDYDDDDENEKQSSEEECSDDESNDNLLENNENINSKTKSLKEDIYGRIRKPDGTVVVSSLFHNLQRILF